MNVKTGLIIGIPIVIFAIIGSVYFLNARNSQTPTSPPPPPVPTALPKEETTQWIDQSEFRFDYPKSLSLDPHDEDQLNYAHVELASTLHPEGRIIIWAKDEKAESIEAWEERENTDGTESIQTTLGDLPAVKTISTTMERFEMYISTLRNGVLYQIEYRMPVDSAEKIYWDGVLTSITDSFVFYDSTKPAADTNSTVPDTSAEVYDTVEEEVIE